MSQLNLLDCIVTGDAFHGQKTSTAVKLTANNLLVQITENQKDLLWWSRRTDASDGTADDRYKGPIEKQYGCRERRSVEVFKNFTAWYPEKWAGLIAEVVTVNREGSVFSPKKKEWVSSVEVSFQCLYNLW